MQGITTIIALIVALALCASHARAQSNCPYEGEVANIRNVRSELYRGQQAFTVSMLQSIQKAMPNQNIFFSPYSTYHALLLAYFGARKHTERELVEALRLQWATDKGHVQRGYRTEKQLRMTRSRKMPLEFSSADKIYFDNSIKISECMSNNFIDELESKDFRNAAEECRIDINRWIANLTRNEIPEMLSSGAITSDTQVVLANAAYFKGQWRSKFDPKDTTLDLFYTTKSKQSFVKMMHKRGTYNLATDERLGAYVLQMPYLTSNDEEEESEISMIIILPPVVENSLESVLSKLTPDTLELALKDSMMREIDIALPTFEFKQTLALVPILRNMGINSIFNNDADLGAFSQSTHINFGDAMHVAKIKVDEEGSTAAAATVLFSFRSARPVEPTKFECNHPFLFLIYDHSAKAILFTGIYRDPMTQK